MSDTMTMTLEEARETFTVTKVHCPHLNRETLQPDFQLFNMSCPFERDGHCAKCPHFVGIYSNDGHFASYGCYEGFCDHPPTEPTG